MSHIIGRGRYARESYPSTGRGSAGIAGAKAYLPLTVVPNALTAPTGVVVAAALLTPAGSGLFFFSFTLAFIASAPDAQFSGAVFAVNGATGVTGGTLTHGLRVATGSPVVVTGGVLQPPSGVASQQVDATGLISELAFSGFVQLPAGTSAVQLVVTSSSGVNYPTLALSGGIYELP